MDVISPQEFYAHFTAIADRAFRLETLPQYLVQSEREEFKAFKKGHFVPFSRTGVNEWDAMIKANVASGKKMQRVHLLPVRLTPYLRYEIHWGYVHTASLGEDIRLLMPSVARPIRTLAKEDFWLFDNEAVVFVRYKKDGTFIRFEREDDAGVINDCCRLRDLFLSHAIPLKMYLRDERNR